MSLKTNGHDWQWPFYVTVDTFFQFLLQFTFQFNSNWNCNSGIQ